MLISRSDPQTFWIKDKTGKRIFARLFLSPGGRLEEIIFHTTVGAERRKVKELAASYSLSVQLYGHAKYELLNFDKIPGQIRKASEQELNGCLDGMNILIIDTNFRSPQRVLNKAIVRIKKSFGIKLDGWVYSLPNEKMVLLNFRVVGQEFFKIWKQNPRRKSAAHPRYLAAQSVGTIQGSQRLFPSTNKFDVNALWFTAGSQIDNRDHFAGKKLELRIAKDRLLSKKGYRRLVRILSAALNQNQTYLDFVADRPEKKLPTRSKRSFQEPNTGQQAMAQYVLQ